MADYFEIWRYGCSFECAGDGDAYGGCPTTPKTGSSIFPPLYGNIPTHYLPNATGDSWLVLI